MSDEEKPVHIPFHAKDHATGIIGKIAGKVEHLGHTVDHTIAHLTEMGTALAGIGGALGFERMVETGKESLEQVSKLAKLTGTSAENVAALRDTFEQSGLSAEAMAGTITRMGKNTLKLEEGGKQLAAEAKKWGVNLTNGPVAAMVSMSESVQKHKIGEAEVQKLTGLSRENLGGMMEMLEQGPEELQKTISEAKKLNVHLADPEALERFKKLHEASTKIHEAFRRISEKVVIALAPALSKMADRFSHWIDSVNVNKFIDPLVKGMEFVVAHAKTLGKVMAANAILMRTTGMGLGGGLMKAGGLAWKIGGGLGARVGGMAASALGGVSKMGGMGGVAGLLGPLQSVLPILMRVVGGATGLGVVAAAIYLVIKHLDYFKEKLGGVAMAIWGSVQKLWGAISNVFSESSAIGRFARWIGEKFIGYLEFVGSMVAKFIGLVADAINWISDAVTALSENTSISKIRAQRGIKEIDEKRKTSGYDAFYDAGGMQRAYALARGKGVVSDADKAFFDKYVKFAEVMGGLKDKDADAALRARFASKKAPESESAPGHGVYQDFRGSRFEIEQKFAEGFDPDRVAIAFSNDLASQGEKRLVSGLTPLFSIR